MKRNQLTRWIALFLAMTLLCLSIGCDAKEEKDPFDDSNNLMNQIKPTKQEDMLEEGTPVEPETLHAGVTDFAV